MLINLLVFLNNGISEFCRTAREPVFITKNGVGDMVVMNIEVYEKQQAQLELSSKLAEAEILQLRFRGYRTLLVENYIVFYVVKGDVVEIRRILYVRRQYENLL